MRRPGYLGDLEDCWFGGFGFVYEDKEREPWFRYGRNISSESFAQRYLEEKRALTRRSKAQGPC